MRKSVVTLVVAMAIATAAGFSSQSASLPTINDSMTKVMSTNAQTIWDISSHAFNNRGDGLVPAKVTAKDWEQLADASRKIKTRALLLARAPKTLVVTGPEEHVMGEDASHRGRKGTWDAASPRQIKALISANPVLFRKRAMILANAAGDLETASSTRDIRVLYRVSSNLDEYCDGCHQPFWGTDEPPPVSAAVRKQATLKGR